MKKITNILSFLLTIMIVQATAQSKTGSDFLEAKIKTSAVCDMCKENLEKAMAFEKGVKRSTLDLDSKILTVTYNPNKTTVENLRKAVAKAGYDADDVPANKKAYNKLAACCKKEAVCNDKK